MQRPGRTLAEAAREIEDAQATWNQACMASGEPMPQSSFRCHSPASAVDRRSEFMQRPLTWMMGFAALYPSYALYRICGHVATLGARYRFMRALIIIPAEKPGGDQTVRATAGRRPGRMPGPSPREGKLAVGTTAAEWASAPATTRVAEGCRPWRWIPASCRNDGGWSNF